MRLLRGGARWSPPVLTASALAGEGIAEVWQALEEHREQLPLHEKRAQQRRAWLSSLVHDGLEAEFFARDDVQALRAEIEDLVQRQAITPTEGARRLLALVSTDAS